MAPKVYLDTVGAELKEVESLYKGAETVWIYVDKDTGRNPQFVSEGDLEDPTDTETRRSVLLSANNPNQIILMDILAGSRAHPHTSGWFTENLNNEGDVPNNPTWVFKYTTYVDHDTVHTYERSGIVVDEAGVVSYTAWKEPFLNSWEHAELRLKMDILDCENQLKDPVVMEIPSMKARYERYISLLKYIQENFVNKIPVWKVEIPLIHQV